METKRMIDRFDTYMEIKGLNDNQVTNDAGLSIGTIGKSRKDGRDLSKRVLNILLETYPDINKVWLLTGEGSMLKTKKIESNAEWVDPSTLNWIEVPVVPYDAMAGIPGGYGDVFPDDLYKKQLVIAPQGAKAADHVIFTVNGDSMEPLLIQGDEILSKLVPLDYYKDSRLHIDHYNVWVIVTRNEGILVKKIIAHDVDSHTITLHSLNTVYKDFVVDLADVTQIYHAVSLHRNHL